MTPPPLYFSYLLRLWRSAQGTSSVWHASLEDPMTGERQGFTSLKSLFAFLEALTAAESSQQSVEGDIGNRSDSDIERN